MSRVHHSGGEPSQRMLRVAELIRHALADLLSRGGVQDPVLDKNVITVPDVRMSPDLKLATAYVMPLGGKDVTEVIKALEKNKKFLRTEIAHKINLKYAPDLRFRVDESFEKSAVIDKLLHSDKVRQDLAKPVSDEDEDADAAGDAK